MSNPPEQPGDANATEPKLSIEEQLDELLSKIEAVEPTKPESQEQPTTAHPTTPKAQPQTQAALADDEINALLDEPSDGAPTKAEIDALLNAPTTQADIDAMLNASSAEAAPAEQEEEQEQMLASLNMALKDMPEQPPADAASEELSMEERLQQEIMALLPPEPKVSEPATPDVSTDTAEAEDDDVLAGSYESPENLAAMEAGQAPSLSTQDQIAMEIESLLATQQPTATAEPTESAIDELDQMLAQEIDADDELAGDFHSVEDLTAGIQVDEYAQAEDEHAATARDVAAELDSQPEDLPAPPQADTSEDPFKELDEIVGKTREDQTKPQRRAALQADDIKDWLQTAKERLLVACYWINWPARRFLTAEWRANLGYIALLNLFFGVGLWIVRILF